MGHGTGRARPPSNAVLAALQEQINGVVGRLCSGNPTQRRIELIEKAIMEEDKQRPRLVRPGLWRGLAAGDGRGVRCNRGTGRPMCVPLRRARAAGGGDPLPPGHGHGRVDCPPSTHSGGAPRSTSNQWTQGLEALQSPGIDPSKRCEAL